MLRTEERRFESEGEADESERDSERREKNENKIMRVERKRIKNYFFSIWIRIVPNLEQYYSSMLNLLAFR